MDDATEQSNFNETAHWYELTLTCRDTLIELNSEDSDFIDKQMRQWLGILTEPGFALPPPPVTTKPVTPPSVANASAVQSLSSDTFTPTSLESPDVTDTSLGLHAHLAQVAETKTLEEATSLPPKSSLAVSPVAQSNNDARVGSDDVDYDLADEQGRLTDVHSEYEDASEPSDDEAHDVDDMQGALEEEPVSDLSERLEPREEDLDLVVNSLMEDLQPDPFEVSYQSSVDRQVVSSDVAQSVDNSPHSVAMATPMDTSGEDDSHQSVAEGHLPDDFLLDPAEPSQPSQPSKPSKPSSSKPEAIQSMPSSLSVPVSHASTDTMVSDDNEGPAYQQLCNQVGAATSEDFLLMSAYFLTIHQQVSPFTLTALNRVIVAGGFPTVTHSVLATALSKGLLSMVPDVRGTAEATEYEITPHGQSTVDMFL